MEELIVVELTRAELDAISIALAAGPLRPVPGRDWTDVWRSVQEKIHRASSQV